jgi:hypothetical protein
MKKIVEIENCLQCRYCKEDGWFESTCCTHPSLDHFKILKYYEKGFPEWCPLENV